VDDYDRIVMKNLGAGDIDVQPDDGKLGELLLLAAEALADDRFAGAVKLNKVLFFAEFAHVRQTGQPITGVRYQKLPHGPAPRRLRPVRDSLVSAGAAELVTETVLGREERRLRPLRPADRSRFSETELQAVKDAVALLAGRTGNEANQLAHEEPGWQLTQDGEDIPYATAYLAQTRRLASPKVSERAQDIAEQYARQGRLSR
jgi:hypothetical protein